MDVYVSTVYKIILFNKEERERVENEGCNYGIVHIKHGTTESMCAPLFAAYMVLEELESELIAHQPKPKMGLVH